MQPKYAGCHLEQETVGVDWVSAFGSGHDPGVLESNLASGSLLSGESAFPSPQAPPSPRALSLSLSNK